MTTIASITMMPATAVAPTEGMATTVLMVEWMVKQLQLLKEKQRQIEALQKENEQLKDSLDKLKNRSSENSSIPPSQDLFKKPSDKSKRKKSKKRGPKYNHPGKTRNGFGKPDQIVSLELENCSVCGEDFDGILSSDCFSAYSPQKARAKQKCLTHFERDLKALETSRFASNRELVKRVSPILHTARTAHQEYHAGELSLAQLQQLRPIVESELEAVLNYPPKKGWASDALGLKNRLKRHWDEWFTFLTHPEVKPDNNDAERALRPVVIHRKVSGGARSDWGAELVAQMFSFLETMRLQGDDAIAQLCELLSLAGRSPPGLGIA